MISDLVRRSSIGKWIILALCYLGLVGSIRRVHEDDIEGISGA
jgi:hypothetical protein